MIQFIPFSRMCYGKCKRTSLVRCHSITSFSFCWYFSSFLFSFFFAVNFLYAVIHSVSFHHLTHVNDHSSLQSLTTKEIALKPPTRGKKKLETMPAINLTILSPVTPFNLSHKNNSLRTIISSYYLSTLRGRCTWCNCQRARMTDNC